MQKKWEEECEMSNTYTQTAYMTWIIKTYRIATNTPGAKYDYYAHFCTFFLAKVEKKNIWLTIV